MRIWKLSRQAVLGLALLALTSCRPTSELGVEATPPLPGLVQVSTSWNQGNGFLVDRGERLIVTSAETVGSHKEVDVVFVVVEDGKVKVRRDFYKQQPKQKAKVLSKDPVRDLAVLQVEAVPEGVQELKLAAKTPDEGSTVQTVVDPGLKSTQWAAKPSTVTAIGDQDFATAAGQRVKGKMLEIDLDSKYSRASGGAPVANEAGEVVGVFTSSAASKPKMYAIEATPVRNLVSDTYRLRGKAAFASKEYQKVVEYCDKALALNPNEAWTHNERGAALSFLNKFDEAIKEYDTALRLNAKMPRAYRNRASAYLHKGDAKKAVEDCSAAIKIDPTYITAYQTRKLAYDALKTEAEAKNDEKGALKMDAESKKDQEIIARLSEPQWKSSGTSADP